MWIARDKCGDLYIYEQKPEKLRGQGIWRTDGRLCSLNYDVGFKGFDGIYWEDDEPRELVLKEGGEG